MDKYDEIKNSPSISYALKTLADLCRHKDVEIAKLEKIVDDLVARINREIAKPYTDNTEGMNEFEEIDKIEDGKMRFSRMMKSPNRLTENKEGCPYGGIRYSAQDKFPPAGGGEK